uniref:hypothetical protein n=1 Tax=Modestobacter versicolor TaxID=429133 RepID=UPI0034DFFBA0
RQNALREKMSNRLASLLESVRSGFDGLYGFADDAFAGEVRTEAEALINDVLIRAGEQEAELVELSQQDYRTADDYERALNSWQGQNDYEMRIMRNGRAVFHDLLNPF